MDDIKVTVLCITYNHEKYIERALNGFLMQYTSFEYEILIHDDASTDGTTEILLEYQKRFPDKIHLILEEENQYSKGIDILSTFLYPQVRGKYVALCEGDDEWLYDKKLQNQYEWMESHPETSLCIHNAVRYQEGRNEGVLQINGLETGFVPDDEIILRCKGMVPTASYFYRTEFVGEIPVINSYAPVGDTPLRNYLACRGKIYYENQAWSVWNYMHAGSWNARMASDDKLVEEYCIKMIVYVQKFNEYSKGRFLESLRTVISWQCERYVRQNYKQHKFVKGLRKVITELEQKTNHCADDICEECFIDIRCECVDYVEWMVNNYFVDIQNSHGILYLYGAGTEASSKAAELLDRCIRFEGFIVSNKSSNPEILLDHSIFDVTKIEEPDSVHIWLCMNRENKREVLPILQRKGFKKIFW